MDDRLAFCKHAIGPSEHYYHFWHVVNGTCSNGDQQYAGHHTRPPYVYLILRPFQINSCHTEINLRKLVEATRPAVYPALSLLDLATLRVLIHPLCHLLQLLVEGSFLSSSSVYFPVYTGGFAEQNLITA